MKHQEYELQKMLCQWLEIQFPKVLFLSDTIASVKLKIPQQLRNKKIQKSGFKCPDLLILEPKKGYAGLFIELKTKSPFKKNGEIYSNDHLKAQQHSLNKLEEKGYKTCFSWEFERTKNIIESYLM
ncbi:hypothetical protein [uncultured Christiangramia sp.]|uniref:hypothetical protein n=1 Tax=uncultured Christiangramia sp. TaxID=503836 RepID=UPI00260F5FA3|nr:hypothetical protein [uncultured Christiangramia sp.]